MQLDDLKHLHICLIARVTRHTGWLVFWSLLGVVAAPFRSALLLLLLLLLPRAAATAAAGAFSLFIFAPAKSAFTLPLL